MTREERKQFEYDRKHILINNIQFRQCTQCKIWKPDTEEYFYLRNKNKINRGFSSECKICCSNRSQKWQKNNDERYRELIKIRDNNKTERRVNNWRRFSKKQRLMGYQIEYRRKNKDKMKKYASQHRIHDILKIEEEAMLKVFNYECAYCGITLEEHKNIMKEKLHKDHVDHEGYNDIRNCVPACKSCNCKKWQYSIDEWYKKYEYYNEDKYNKIIWWITEGYKDYIKEKPPYIITRKHNEDKRTYHYELWTVDEKRNMVECISIGDKKKDLKEHINNYLKTIN